MDAPQGKNNKSNSPSYADKVKSKYQEKPSTSRGTESEAPQLHQIKAQLNNSTKELTNWIKTMITKFQKVLDLLSDD